MKEERPLRFTPVRTSLGTPRYLPEGGRFPAIRELMPYGLMKLDGDEFSTAYRQRLDGIGVEAIQARFEKVYAIRELPLILLCFENVLAGEHCHRREFADWWYEQTGQRVREASL